MDFKKGNEKYIYRVDIYSRVLLDETMSGHSDIREEWCIVEKGKE
jgi:hypothetical protein